MARRTTSRRSAPRRRTMRRRTTRSRRTRRVTRRVRTMTRRRVLDIASRKKQDNMLQWVPTDPANPAGAGAPNDFNINASGVIGCFLFQPSYRTLDSDGTTKDEPQARTEQSTYARGYREVTTLRITGGAPWRRRRITFSAKGFPGLLTNADNLFTGDFFRLYTSVGYVRMTVGLSTTFQAIVYNTLFRGFQGQDWSSVFNAKVDNSRLTIHSDVTSTYNPGNDTGTSRIIRQWSPLNKTLVYNDDEAGITEQTSGNSTLAKAGMGDFFVIDMYQSGLVDAASGLTINNEGTYYWHER